MATYYYPNDTEYYQHDKGVDWKVSITEEYNSVNGVKLKIAVTTSHAGTSNLSFKVLKDTNVLLSQSFSGDGTFEYYVLYTSNWITPITFSFAVDDYPTDVSVSYSLSEYIINYYTNTSATDVFATETVKFGDTLAITDESLNKNGYTFVGWKDGNDIIYTSDDSLIVTMDIDFIPVWTENIITLELWSGNYIMEDDRVGELLPNCILDYYEMSYNDTENVFVSTQYLDEQIITRYGYKYTGYVGTKENGGIVIKQGTTYSTALELAEAFGVSEDFNNGNVTVKLYPQWITLTSYNNNGKWIPCKATYIKVNGIWCQDIMRRNFNGKYTYEIAVLLDEEDNILTDENGNILVDIY